SAGMLNSRVMLVSDSSLLSRVTTLTASASTIPVSCSKVISLACYSYRLAEYAAFARGYASCFTVRASDRSRGALTQLRQHCLADLGHDVHLRIDNLRYVVTNRSAQHDGGFVRREMVIALQPTGQ